MTNHSAMQLNNDTIEFVANELGEPRTTIEKIYETLIRYEKDTPKVYVVKAGRERSEHYGVAKEKRFLKEYRFVGKEDPKGFAPVRSISGRKR